jgi:Zn-dependent protease
MNIQTAIIFIAVVVVSLTVHEVAHGYAAFRLGDLTAKNAGRLSLNPAVHLDFMGMAVFLISMLAFGMPFGWAKPVPVDVMQLKKPKRDMVLVAFAGPLSNVFFALAIGFFAKFFLDFTFISNIFVYIFYIAVQVNLGLAIFNFIPIYPLDGFRVLIGILPVEYARKFAKATKYAPHVMLGIIVLERLIKYPILPQIFSFIFNPWFSFWGKIIGL